MSEEFFCCYVSFVFDCFCRWCFTITFIPICLCNFLFFLRFFLHLFIYFLDFYTEYGGCTARTVDDLYKSIFRDFRQGTVQLFIVFFTFKFPYFTAVSVISLNWILKLNRISKDITYVLHFLTYLRKRQNWQQIIVADFF